MWAQVSDPTPEPTSTAPPTIAASPPSTASVPPVAAAGPASPPTSSATAFPFALPAPPGPGDTQALATNQTDGGVVYRVAYAVVTVSGDQPVTNDNSAFAIASCNACTTVAVSFQVVLVVGESQVVAPIDAAGALNYDCPACMTTAIATQLVVTLTAEPPEELKARLNAALQKLNLLPLLGASATPDQIAAQVTGVQEDIENLLRDSGLLAEPLPTASPTATSPTASTSAVPTQRASSEPVGSAYPGSDSPTQSDTSTPSPSDTPTPTPTPSQSATSTDASSPTPSSS